MSACTFFGHSDYCSFDDESLRSAIRQRIEEGDDIFYVGDKGAFDWAVYRCLKKLQKEYPHIQIGVVLAYLPSEKDLEIPDSMVPEGLETVHPKFAIDKRNHWMLTQSHSCICYIDHTWGGAYKFASLAKRHGLTLINIGSANL